MSPEAAFNCVESTEYSCLSSLLGQSVGLFGLLFQFSSVFSEAPGSWVYVSYVRLSKDPIYGSASWDVYILNLMGQVLVSYLTIHGQILVSCRLGGKLDKQASHSGSLHLHPGCWRSLLE